MPKDVRHYAKFTLDFPDNPKILPLSDAAFRCLVEMTIWSRFHQTDGFIPRRVAVDNPVHNPVDKPVDNPEASAQARAQPRGKWVLQILHELCNNDPDHPSLLEREDGWIIRDYAEHQDTKAEIRARLDHAKTAGRKGGQASAQARAQAGGRARGQPSAQAKSNQRKRKSSSSYELELEQSSAHRANPNGRGVAPLARDEAIRTCGLCDDRGYIGLKAGPFITCPHSIKQIEELEQQYAAEANQ